MTLTSGKVRKYRPLLTEDIGVIIVILDLLVIYTKNHCYSPGTFLGITPVSSVSDGLYFLTLPLVSVMRVIYTSTGISKKFGVRVIYRKIRYLESFLNVSYFSLIGNILFCTVLSERNRKTHLLGFHFYTRRRDRDHEGGIGHYTTQNSTPQFSTVSYNTT
jgi:hypothetical protein